MQKFQAIFQRYELKYRLSDEKYHQLMDALKEQIDDDSYGEISVCNIYFDTPSKILIRNSIEKPVFKEKLRIRSYGIPKKEDKVFIELKKKHEGVVYKRREKLPLVEANNYLHKEIIPSKESQIIKEINYFINHYKKISGGMEASMFISYDRIAFMGKADNQLRITFDRNLLWREENLSFEHGIYGKALLEEGERLMEIKISGAMPLWLSTTLSNLKIYPSSYSKYGKAYEASLMEGDVREKSCIRMVV